MTQGAPTTQDLEKLLAFAVSQRLEATCETASSSSATNVVTLSTAQRLDEARPRQTLDLLLRRYFDAPSAGPEYGTPVASAAEEAGPFRRGQWLAGGLAVAAAAILLVALWPTAPETSGPVPLLEEYTASPVGLWGGSMRGRAGDDAPTDCKAAYHVQSPFGVILRPRVDIRDPLVVLAHVQSSDGRSSWFDELQAEAHDGGTIEVREPMVALGLSPGDWVARFFIMRRDQRLAHEILESLGEGLHPGVTVVEISFCVVEG